MRRIVFEIPEFKSRSSKYLKICHSLFWRFWKMLRIIEEMKPKNIWPKSAKEKKNWTVVRKIHKKIWELDFDKLNWNILLVLFQDCRGTSKRTRKRNQSLYHGWFLKYQNLNSNFQNISKFFMLYFDDPEKPVRIFEVTVAEKR